MDQNYAHTNQNYSDKKVILFSSIDDRVLSTGSISANVRDDLDAMHKARPEC